MSKWLSVIQCSFVLLLVTILKLSSMFEVLFQRNFSFEFFPLSWERTLWWVSSVWVVDYRSLVARVLQLDSNKLGASINCPVPTETTVSLGTCHILALVRNSSVGLFAPIPPSMKQLSSLVYTGTKYKGAAVDIRTAVAVVISLFFVLVTNSVIPRFKSKVESAKSTLCAPGIVPPRFGLAWRFTNSSNILRLSCSKSKFAVFHFRNFFGKNQVFWNQKKWRNPNRVKTAIFWKANLLID